MEQIAALAALAPIDPILVRAQWPDMTGDDVVAYLDDLGRDIVPAVREITSVPRVVRSASDPIGRSRLTRTTGSVAHDTPRGVPHEPAARARC